MTKKRNVVIITIMIVISLLISIYLPNRDKIEANEDTSINYSIIEKNGKYGVAKNGTTLIEPQYNEVIIPNPHRTVFFCINEQERKFVNAKNEEIFKEFNSVELIEYQDSKYEKNILKYENNGRFGLLGITGKIITNSDYEEISNFGNKEGEVLVKEGSKYGILNEKGIAKIEIKYDLIESDQYYTEQNGWQRSGYIVRQTTIDGYRYGYYDSEGVKVLTEEYNQLSRLTQIESNDVYLIAAQNGQFGVFINNSKIINTQYQEIDYNSDLQIFIVERTGKFGAITLKGTEILKPEYTELQINGIYIYTIKDEEKKVWDTSGKEVDISFETVIQKTESEYFIKNESGYYSVLDSNFKTILKQKYKYLELIYDNCFIATNEQEKTGIIDFQENIIVDFKYDVIQLIKGKFAIQAIDFATNNAAFYDSDFSLTTEVIGANIEYLENSFKVYNDEKEILLDNNGKFIKK